MLASLLAILSWILEGKNDRNLLMVSDAELVWSVEKTKCPLSAILSTVSAVSVSRISPMKTISGSCLKSDLSAFLKDRESCPTCLCEMIHLFGLKRNSIGSSIVIKLSVLVLLICSNIETIEVDFQLPVGPVTRKSPFLWLRMLFLIVSA